jgi:hypothetical protein
MLSVYIFDFHLMEMFRVWPSYHHLISHVPLRKARQALFQGCGRAVVELPFQVGHVAKRVEHIAGLHGQELGRIGMNCM